MVEERFAAQRQKAREVIAARRAAEEAKWIKFDSIDDLFAAARALPDDPPPQK